MQKIVCKKHKLELCIPTKDREFLLGKMHNDVAQLQSHHKQFPYCKFEKVGEEI
mgnify:CR=1 FL=1|jgi:hypothetical protein